LRREIILCQRPRMAASKVSARPSIGSLLRLPAGPVTLADVDPRATPGFKGGKSQGKEATLDVADVLAEQQERLYADGRTGGTRSVLLVLQGMDGSGKGGTVKHVVGQVDPQGVHLASFGKPTREELGHDFLWRIKKQVPPAGRIGVFDRSHYEDVLVVRVRELVPKRTWSRRYDTINRWEQSLVAGGCTVVKCFLHISADEQRARMLARLDDPTKHWKYNPHDVDDRALWPAFTEAYEAALERCNTDIAPWYLVPADRKWYRNWAITHLLLEHLQGLALEWPKGDFDVAAEKQRVRGSTP
jgi:PPK2 family polyphosphate:nucleotide phosphotransferase